VGTYYKRVSVGGITNFQSLFDVAAAGPCAASVCEVYKVEQLILPDGTTINREHRLSPMEVSVLTGNADPQFLNQLAMGMLQAQVGLNEVLGGETDADDLMERVDEVEESAASGGDTMFAILDPTLMLALGSRMASDAAAGAAAADDSLDNSNELAQTDLNQQISIIRQLEYAGPVPGGSGAVQYRKEGLESPTQNVDGQEYAITSANIIVDPNEYRFLKQRLEGTATTQGQTREFFIEFENSDYRNPPGCGSMEEPYARVMRMGGMLDDEQMAEMEEARAQLAEFEQQLASMPEQQRAMMERMMGSQMETMRGLVDTGAIEYTHRTEELVCNPDLASVFSVGVALPNQPSQPESEEALVRRIQEYLVILGYEPGNIEGVLDALTQVAISQFQAEQGMQVTGEPSAELAEILAQAVEG
jgi:hypothetical protein